MTLIQTESFVPLTSAPPRRSGERLEFQATVISQPDAAQNFPSVATAGIPAITGTTARAANCEPKVSVQRDGNRVTGIHLQCSCGQAIDLACVYEVPAAQPAIPPQPAVPQPATTPQPAPKAAKPEAKPGKICKDSRKEMPIPAAKKQKVPEKGRGTSAAKRRSA